MSSSAEKYTEDPKMTFQDSERRSKPYIGIAVLVLSLLLGVSVSALVYQTVSAKQQVWACQQTAEPKHDASTTNVDVKATVTLKTDSGNKIEDEITYDKARNVAYYHGSDGSFDVDDFGKGIHITRNSVSRVCYLIAVGGSNQTSNHDFEKMLRDMDGSEVQAQDGKEMLASIVPGDLTDLSFIPSGAHRECVNGYRWMTFVPADGDNVGDRKKRAATCSICGWLWHRGRPYKWHCYSLTQAQCDAYSQATG